MKIHSKILLVLLLIWSCKEHRTRDEISASSPNIDTINFHLVKPSNDFMIDEYDPRFVVFVNTREKQAIKDKQAALDRIVVEYGIEEKLSFTNYGRPYLRLGDPDSKQKIDTLHETLEITYNVKNKEYDIQYHFSPKPDDPYVLGWKIYHEPEKIDSVLNLWGEKPLKEWSEK